MLGINLGNRIGIGMSNRGGVNKDFVIKVDTTNAGSASDTMIIPTDDVGTAYDCTVDWGDGDSNDYTGAAPTIQHTYASGGIKTITISGTFPTIKFDDGGDKDKLIEIVNWGAVGWVSFNNAFYGCSNLVKTGGYSDTSSVTNMRYMFSGCSSV